jgi:hypothetical protein
LAIYSSPQDTLVHLLENAIPLELRITGQEVPQKLVRLGNSLIVSLLGFLEHLLGMHNLHLARLLVILGGCTLGPNWLLEILQGSGQLVNNLGQLPTLHVESFLVDETYDCNDMHKVFFGISLGEDGNVEDGPIRKLDLEALQRFIGGH